MSLAVVADTKRCPSCTLTKPVSEFSWRAGKKYRRSRCKPCESKVEAAARYLRAHRPPTTGAEPGDAPQASGAVGLRIRMLGYYLAAGP